MQVVSAKAALDAGLVGGCAAAVAIGLWMSPRIAAPMVMVLAIAAGATAGSARTLRGVCVAIALFLGASAVRRIRDDARSARRELARTQIDRGREARAAALAERTQIARDLHDVLSHNLAALSVQLEAAHALLGRSEDATHAREFVERARATVREALADARGAIFVLNGEYEMPSALIELAQRFEQTTGWRCQIRADTALGPLPAGGDVALYRGAQEGLTNALKHGRPTEVWIGLDHDPSGVELRVGNVGATGAVATTEPAWAGRGLEGLRHRAEALGGSLQAGAVGDRFELRMRIPYS